MKLKEYLKKNRISIQNFASDAGLSALTVMKCMRGEEPRFDTALKIYKQTNKAIDLEELVPNIYQLCIKEFINKHVSFAGEDES